MEFIVYENRLDDVVKALDRMNKKAQKYEVPFAYSIGDEFPATVRVLGVDPVTNTTAEVNRFVVAAVRVSVECDSFIRANGWTVCARIEHGENGNIVTEYEGHNAEWYTLAPNCDHCKTNRPRKITFIVENENGEVRQVGSGCLKEYTGINPNTAILWGEVRDLMDNPRDMTTKDWRMAGLSTMYNVVDVLAHAWDCIKANGYVKSGFSGATKDKAMELVKANATPSENGLKMALAMVDWLKGLATDDPDVGSLELDCIPLAKSGFCKSRHVGRLAYIPMAYDKYTKKQADKLARATKTQAQALTSDYVGTVGERFNINVKEIELVTSWPSDYGGYTYLYKFLDNAGNVFVWFASSSINISNVSVIKATVKNHNERDGIKQTIVNRCKVVA